MIALDLFAGVGWALACRALGITDRGVDNAATVVETRRRAGLETIYQDVWDGLFGVHGVGRYDILIASPPCQTFSPAGKGAGRKALDEVLAAIHAGLYRDPVALHALTVSLDPRTALVLTPLAHVYRDRPQFVVLEQVTPVLPVWDAYAAVMRELGYSVVTGVLNAEQYGVPQTRRRAILIARRDGIAAAMPEPTHSRYYSHAPGRLDLGVRQWVSMAEALGFDGFEAQKVMGKGMVERHGQRPGRDAAEPAFTIRATAGGMEPGGFVLVGNQRPSGGEGDYQSRPMDRPAQTLTAGSRSWGFALRSNYGTGGDPRNRGERLSTQPAPTITSKAGRSKWDGVRKMTVQEAATLQSFPADFEWAGTKTDDFQIIGNAVPPLFGQHVLAAATAGALDVPEAVAA
jgi:DNA (cytosine-5)-methyltransferase 1